MDPSSQRITPLRQRMIDDMRMRKLEHKTQEGYVVHAKPATGGAKNRS